MNARELEEAGTKAVKELRLKTLASGWPFMINCNELPIGQCYYEYPDGSIHMVTICRKSFDFKTLKILSADKAQELRSKCKLS